MNNFKVFEIDPKKKYILECEQHLSLDAYEKIKEEIKAWLSGGAPFLILNGVKFAKVDDIPAGSVGVAYPDFVIGVMGHDAFKHKIDALSQDPNYYKIVGDADTNAPR